MRIPIFTYSSDLGESILIKNLENFSIIEVEQGFMSLNRKEVVISNNDNIKELNNSVFFQNRVKNEEVLDFVIVTNTECNLECTYCYETGIKQHQKINIDNNQIFKFMEYSIVKYTTKNISVEFTGGEPILNFGYINKMVSMLKTNFPNRKFNYSIITNGTLLGEEHLKFFNLNDFSMQISIDGSRSFHNKERIGKGFENTYDLILNNIKRILIEYPKIKLAVRLNISNKNSGSINELIEELKDAIKSEYRSKVFLYFDFVDVPTFSMNYISEEKKIELLTKLFYLLYDSGFGLKSEYIIGGNCMIKNDNSVTILPNGDLVKCYSLVGDETYKEIKPTENYKMDIKGIKPLVPICNNYNCDMFYLCKGGCPYREYIEKGNLSKYCNPKLVETANKILFVFELDKFGLVSREINSIDDLIKECDNVQVHEICF